MIRARDKAKGSYWSSKSVVITGGVGFIGSAVTRKLVRAGARVSVIDNLSKDYAHSNLKEAIGNVEFHRINLARMGTAETTLSQADICFNFAAKIGGIIYFHKHPATSIRDNALINLNLWDAARKTKPKMICLSSSMVFENASSFPTPESALGSSPPPSTGYGFSKLLSEYIARTYFEEFGIPFVICRPFNAYGPGEIAGDYDGYAHVVPDLIRKVTRGDDPVELIGDGEQTRCFTYVEDVADAIIFVAQHTRNDDFNIGTGVETSVIQLVQKIWTLAGRKGLARVKINPSPKHDVRRRVPDVSKLLTMGWKPKTELEEGLKATMSWVSALR